MSQSDEIICELSPSVSRRAIGSGVLWILAGLLLYVAFIHPPREFHFLALLLIMGGLTAYGGWRMWHATGRVIILTRAGLHLSDGMVIAAFDDIVKVDRSFFAFKPSNGFLVVLSKSYPRAWIPGLLWRFGRRVGIGGVTSAQQGKFMADMINALIAQRNGDLELPDP